jgi:hypothetical protein
MWQFGACWGDAEPMLLFAVRPCRVRMAFGWKLLEAGRDPLAWLDLAPASPSGLTEGS